MICWAVKVSCNCLATFLLLTFQTLLPVSCTLKLPIFAENLILALYLPWPMILSMVPHGHKLIPQSQSKGCPLDPIPTSLLKSCSDTLTPVNTGVVNQSLPTGSVPECFKQAQVTPLLKKPGLDKNALENHCPVSNCHFFQDFLRVILVEHITNDDLLELKQSAYC